MAIKEPATSGEEPAKPAVTMEEAEAAYIKIRSKNALKNPCMAASILRYAIFLIIHGKTFRAFQKKK